MNARETNFGSPSGEPSTKTTRPMPQQMCEKLWTLPRFPKMAIIHVDFREVAVKSEVYVETLQ